MVYKNFGRPFLKIFIGSLVCYQAAYWAWNKLEREDMVHRSGNGTISLCLASIDKLPMFKCLYQSSSSLAKSTQSPTDR